MPRRNDFVAVYTTRESVDGVHLESVQVRATGNVDGVHLAGLEASLSPDDALRLASQLRRAAEAATRAALAACDLDAMRDPKVEVLAVLPNHRRVEYRLSGGDVAPEWSQSHAESLERQRAAGREVPADQLEVWCRLTVWYDGDNRPSVGSYGGTVWPMAWPHLFEALPPSVARGSASVKLTPRGLALLRSAEEAKS